MEDRWNEKSLSDLSGSFWQACTLQAAVKLDLFTLLGEEEKSAADLAAALPADLRGITALLNALAAMGLLVKRNGFFSNTGASARCLSRNSGQYLGWRMLHHHYLLPSWTRLDEAVSKGKPQLGENGTEQEDARREAFLMAMYSNALPVSQWIVPRLPLEGYRNLLDLGGGPGTYAAQFCLRNPGLEAIVFDLPASRVYAEKTIASFGLRDRIGFRGGDFFRDQIPGEYDVVWMSHILHSFGPDECRNLMGNAVRALRPGGLLLVHDFILDDSGDGPLFPALFALNMLVRTSKGRSYTGSEIMGLLSGAGLRKIRRLELSIPNGSGVIAGEKDGKLT